MSTAVLSITNKQKKKDHEKKKGKEGEDKMEVDEKKDDKKEKMEVDEKKDDDKEKKEEKADEPEPNFELLSNPARVMKAQLKVVSLEDGKEKKPSLYDISYITHPFSVKYQPIKDLSIGGVIMLNRAKLGADEKEEVTKFRV